MVRTVCCLESTANSRPEVLQASFETSLTRCVVARQMSAVETAVIGSYTNVQKPDKAITHRSPIDADVGVMNTVAGESSAPAG